MKTNHRLRTGAGIIGLLLAQMFPGLPWPGAAARPNVIVILSDDMGFSDLGCYGSEIRTPNLDRLAGNGLRFTQFYNTARCCPTRASLLTGLYPHQAGVGHMINDHGREGYRGELNRHSVTIAEALKPAGYRTYAVGKWHVARNLKTDGPKQAWPLQRGFDRFYGTITGAGNYFDPGTLTRDNTGISPYADPEYRPARYYYTEALSDHAVRFLAEHQREQAGRPFFLYLAYTAAHWPMQALERDIAKYRGQYDAGYEPIRRARFEKEKQLGLVKADSPFPPSAGDWAAVTNRAWEARCMEVYAAMVDCMDQGIGRVVAELKKQGQFENTLIFFLQDNGGCAELVGRQGLTNRADRPTLPPIALEEARRETRPKQTRAGYPVLHGPGIMPGPEDTFIAYGRAWANVSNTPFREYKHWVHEGGIASPLIAHWPSGIPARGELRHQPGHLIDIMATCVEVAGATYPAEVAGNRITPLEGKSLGPAFRNDPVAREALYWEHEGNRAMRMGPWKLVAKGPAGPWELYDLDADRTELRDLAAEQPQRVKDMVARWEIWARRAHVLPWIWRPAYGQAASPEEAGREVAEVDEAALPVRKQFELDQGDDLSRNQAPRLADQAFTITAEITELAPDGVILAQGGSAHGVALYLKEGRLTFAIRRNGTLSRVTAPEPLTGPRATVTAKLARDGTATLTVNRRAVASAKLPGLLVKVPQDGLQVGQDANGAVGDYEAPFTFSGKLRGVTLEIE